MTTNTLLVIGRTRYPRAETREEVMQLMMARFTSVPYTKGFGLDFQMQLLLTGISLLMNATNNFIDTPLHTPLPLLDTALGEPVALHTKISGAPLSSLPTASSDTEQAPPVPSDDAQPNASESSHTAHTHENEITSRILSSLTSDHTNFTQQSSQEDARTLSMNGHTEWAERCEHFLPHSRDTQLQTVADIAPRSG